MGEFEPIELEEMVRHTIRQIESGAEGRFIRSSIKFKLQVREVKKAEGGLKCYVFSGGAGASGEKFHEISFEIDPKNDVPDSYLEFGPTPGEPRGPLTE